MKKRVIWLTVSAVALGLGACKKKEEVKTPEVPAAVNAPAEPAPVPEVKAPAISPEERAAKLGFVQHLPQETEVVMAFHNGSKTADRLQSSKLWKLVQTQMGAGIDMEPDDEPEMEDEESPMPEGEQDTAVDAQDSPDEASTDEPMGPAALFGTEFTIALGKSVGAQTANLLQVNRRATYLQMRLLAKSLVQAAKSGDFKGLQDLGSAGYSEDMFKELLADPESGVALFERMQMPPLYLAFRASPAQHEAAAQQLAQLVENLGMLGEMVEPVEVEKAGQKFAGHRVLGTKLSASLAEGREEMEEMLEPAAVDQLLAAVAKKNLVVLSGTVGNYVILFIGSSTDDLKIAPDIQQSLVASNALTFCDAYASKELAAVVYGQKESINQMIGAVGGLSDIASGLRDGLAGSDGLGDTRDLETLLQIVAEREAALRKLAGNETFGMAAFFEDGLKIESFGGTDNGMIDWKSPNRLAPLGDSEDVAMFANMTVEAAYDEHARAYLEALMETSYAATMKIADLPNENEEMAQFKAMAKMFDTQFRPDLVAMWDALSGDMGDGLGGESAWVVDLNGSVPAVPGIPQPVVDDGKFPRISLVAPVTDRTKLAASWQKMNSSLTGVMASIGKMTGQEIPMQKPISSEKDGYTTWFFPLPFFNDDFMPSVTVGDQWFAASTSKNQALDLISKAAKGGETRTGMILKVNFKTLEKFLVETQKILEKNSGALGIPNQGTKDTAKFIEILADLDTLTVHARREGGQLRSSVHLKTR